MTNKDRVIAYLNKMKISYQLSYHAPIYTIDALVDYKVENGDKIAKNLFLRNDSGNVHYLVTVRQDKQVDLKALRQELGSSRLGFASEERLEKYLKLTKGSVSPLGLLNDESKKVVFVIDEDLKHEKIIGVHPNENDASIWISFTSLIEVIKSCGNPVYMVKI